MDDAVLDEVLGRGRVRSAGRLDPGGRHPARSRPLNPRPLDRGRPHSRRAARCPGRCRAPGRARPDDGLAPRGPSRADAPGPRGRRDDGRHDLRQPAPVQRRRRLHAVPAQRGTRPGHLPRPKASTSCSRPTPSEVYPPGFDTVVSVGAVARAARGRGAPGSLRRRRDGRRDPVRPGRRGPRLLRPEGRPAGHGHPPDGARPGDPDRGHRLSDRPRARRPRAVVAQRPPDAPSERAAAPVLRRALLAARDALGGGRAVGRCPARRDAGRRSPPSRWPTSTTSPWPMATTLAELDRVDGPALLSLAVRFGTTRLIDNELLERRTGRLMPGMAAGGRILLAYLVYFAAIGAAFPYLPVFYHDIGLGLEQIGILTALQAAIQLLLAPGLGRPRRPLPAYPRDAPAGSGGRDGRRHAPVPCHRLPDRAGRAR